MRMLPFSPLSFFTVTAGEYEALNFTASHAKTATMFIYGACIGVIAAALYMFYQQSVPGGAIRAILRAEALSPESAKTAEELGLLTKPFCLWELTRGSSVRRFVKTVQDEAQGDRYYIPEELKYRAQIRFDRKGNRFGGLLFTMVLSLGLALILVNLLPVVLGMIDGLLK